MKLEPFALERLQSTWEHRVAWNLAESGVHPLRLEELAIAEGDRRALMGQELGYTQTNGTPELRAAIAALYPRARPDHVVVTNGGSEANCVALWHLVEPGDEIVLMTPNYMQIGGIARSLGAVTRAWPLMADESRWRPDLDALDSLVTSVVALSRRAEILARTRGIIKANYPVVRKWIEKRAPKLTHVAPEAGAIAFVRYRHAINSTALVERLRTEQSVLLVPGDHFEMDGYLRIGFGNHPAHVVSALDLAGQLLDGIA